jgi:hypothetical protein
MPLHKLIPGVSFLGNYYAIIDAKRLVNINIIKTWRP